MSHMLCAWCYRFLLTFAYKWLDWAFYTQCSPCGCLWVFLSWKRHLKFLRNCKGLYFLTSVEIFSPVHSSCEARKKQFVDGV